MITDVTLTYGQALLASIAGGVIAVVSGWVLLARESAKHRARRATLRRRVRPGVICRAEVTAIRCTDLGLSEDASIHLLVWACPWAYPQGIAEADVIRAAVRAPRYAGVVDVLPHVLAVDPVAPIPGSPPYLRSITARVMHWRAVLDEYIREHTLTHELATGGAA